MACFARFAALPMACRRSTSPRSHDVGIVRKEWDARRIASLPMLAPHSGARTSGPNISEEDTWPHLCRFVQEYRRTCYGHTWIMSATEAAKLDTSLARRKIIRALERGLVVVIEKPKPDRHYVCGRSPYARYHSARQPAAHKRDACIGVFRIFGIGKAICPCRSWCACMAPNVTHE